MISVMRPSAQKFLCVLSVICSLQVSAQQLLFQKSRHKVVLYEVGDNITFRLHGDKTSVSARITGLQDSLIIFRLFKVRPDEISHMHVDHMTKGWFLKYALSPLLLRAGFGYLLLDVINTGEFDEHTIAISAGIVGAGILAKLVVGEWIPVRRRTKLEIIR